MAGSLVINTPKGIARSQAILKFIREFTTENGYSPSVREVAAAVGLRGYGNTADYLRLMRSRGLVTFTDGSFRTLRVVQ